MGQVLGEGAFNQQGNKLTIDGDFRNKQFILVPRLFTHLVQVTGLPGPVTRIHK